MDTELKPIDWLSERERLVRITRNAAVVNDRYDIPLDRCSTEVEAFHWLVHLLEKNWITREMLFDLICELEDHFGYDLHSYGQ